jgi:hypothetical protein
MPSEDSSPRIRALADARDRWLREAPASDVAGFADMEEKLEVDQVEMHGVPCGCFADSVDLKLGEELTLLCNAGFWNGRKPCWFCPRRRLAQYIADLQSCGTGSGSAHEHIPFAVSNHRHGACLLLVLVAFLLAGTVKGVIGMGLPTVAMGLLGVAMLPTQAAALLLIPRPLPTSGNWRRAGHLRSSLKRLWPLLLHDHCRTGSGFLWIGNGSGAQHGRALGGALFLYALCGLLLPTLKVSPLLPNPGWGRCVV